MVPLAVGEDCPATSVEYEAEHSTVRPVSLSVQQVSTVVVVEFPEIAVSVCVSLKVLKVPIGMVLDSIDWLPLFTDSAVTVGLPLGCVAQDSVDVAL